MAKFPFLSDEWFSEVKRLVDEHGIGDAPAHANMVMNLCVTDTPFGADRVMHMGTKDGAPLLGEGNLEAADVTITTDYITAKDVFISGNPQAGMQAFMAGKVKIQGDMTKLMAAQGNPGGNALSTALQDITE